MNTVCGLDFGTSNSTIGINIKNRPCLIALEDGEQRLRSAIFYNTELQELVYGERAVHQYLEGEPGRLMMSLKSLLGSSLMNDKTLVGNKLVPYTQIIGEFIKYLKQQAEKTAGCEITQVVLGRPVVFHQDPEKDRLAQDTLENIARQQGFSEIVFQYEPLAAGLDYESTLTEQQLVLVIDMGGGTSDFSIIQLGKKNPSLDRSKDILANHGIRIAGNDFDRRLSLATVMPLLGMNSIMKGSSGDIIVPNAIYYELTSWHLLRKLYTQNAINDVRRISQVAYQKLFIKRLLEVLIGQQGHLILHTIETAKKYLSEAAQTHLNLNFIEEDLSVAVSRLQFNESINEYRQNLLTAIKETVQRAGIKFNEIQAIFYTGGTTKVPVVRQDISQLFPQAAVIQGNIFGSVGQGLTWEAMKRF